MFDWKKPTVQMLGRWQPWHDGHQELFKRCVAKTGQVIIQVRDVQGASGGIGSVGLVFITIVGKDNAGKEVFNLAGTMGTAAFEFSFGIGVGQKTYGGEVISNRPHGTPTPTDTSRVSQ